MSMSILYVLLFVLCAIGLANEKKIWQIINVAFWFILWYMSK